MTRKMRGAALVALSAAATLALSACSGGSDDSGDQGSDGGPVTLTMWTNASTGPGTAYFAQMAKDFHAKYPDVTLKIQNIQNEDYDGKLQTAINSGSAPDVFYQRGGGKMGDMVDAGQLLDLSDLITDETKTAIGEGVLTSEQIDGKTYAMPYTVTPGGMWYSTDLFDKAGVTTPPTTIDDLNTAVTQLKATGVAPVALGGKDAWPAAHWYYWFALRECSKDTLDSTAKSLKFDDPCWTKAGDDLQAFAATKPFNDGFLTTSAQQGANSSAGMLASHKAAQELMGAWEPGVVASLTTDKKPLPDLSFYAFPAVTGGQGDPKAIMGGVDGFSCSAKAPKQACGDLLNFLVTQDTQEQFYKAFDAPPVNKAAQAVITEPYLKTAIAAYNEAPYVSLWLDTLYGANVGNALNTAVVNLLAGKGSVADIVSSVDSAAAKG
ncbi:ABC transporter substrate-binding protein [Luteimicrobium subarcticum]|uniref:Carbohydrate ABC transporter substrate-binding protein (CUT1 family) n=1 Tax=Luteimicrobium subarcticum TaxID=620910 RepID=A0A2M8WJ87_9MICO|nr:extracellular solute-binding protein [Luteimicrobium subarcticum]PJI90991.1 carbohydrate ABC transporter substrate-binding protein (CUT1 family) [Luteimicrobium subarcticum]